MTVFSLAPAFVQINYHTLEAPHKQLIPTLAWDENLGTEGKGGYINWNAAEVDADTMITSLVTDLAVLFPDTTLFDDYVIFTKADAEAPNLPRAANALGVAGAGVTAAVPAAMQTWSFRTADFNHFKLVLLDLVVASGFLPTTPGNTTDAQDDVIADLTAATQAWSARDNSRITTLIRITAKINDVLRHAYRLD